jgi:hypothetical protein
MRKFPQRMPPRRRPRLKEHLTRAQDKWRDPLLTALTVALLCLMFVIAPLDAAGIIEAGNYGFALILVVAGCVLVVSARATAAAVMLVSLGLVTAAAILRYRHHSTFDIYLDVMGWTAIDITLIWVVSSAVFGPGRVTYHRVIGAILLYLTIGLTFVPLYAFVGLLVPGAYSGLMLNDDSSLFSHLIYFSFVTLTTIGYGDIIPVHPLARSLSNVEGIMGQLYPATLLARLVTLELEGRRS